MEAVNNLLAIILNAQTNPLLFTIIVVILSLITGFGGFFFKKVRRIMREKEAQAKKEQDRQRDLDELEQTHSEATTSVRDRIRRSQNEKES